MKILRRVLVIGVALIACSVNTTLSESGTAYTQSLEAKLTKCEENIALLSDIHHEAGEDGLIIVIARLGDGERRRELNRRRLHNVRVYLTEFGWHRSPETLITAEGERVKGYGRIELYVKGKLSALIGLRRNQDLLVGSCEDGDIRPVKAESNLYPYLDKRPRRK